MKHKGIYTACLIMLLAAFVQVQAGVPIPDPLPPIDIRLLSHEPRIHRSRGAAPLRVSGPTTACPRGPTSW